MSNPYNEAELKSYCNQKLDVISHMSVEESKKCEEIIARNIIDITKRVVRVYQLKFMGRVAYER